MSVSRSSGVIAYSAPVDFPGVCRGILPGPAAEPCELEPEQVEADFDPEVHSQGWTCPRCGAWNELPA